MLKNYPLKSDLTVLNTIYLYPQKDKNNKWTKDKLLIIYKDNVTGEKHYEEIERPEYEFYMAKSNEYIDHNMLFIENDRVESISVPYHSLHKKIAELTGNMQFYNDNISNGNRYENNRLFTHPRIFMADQHIEDHYRFRFSKNYMNKIIPISKAYFDIETDIINMKGDFPEMGECPINAVSIINDVTSKVYVLLLRNKDNPLIQEFEDSINDGLFKELKDFVRDTVGGWKNEIRYGLDKFDYEFMFYDEEIQLIQDMFILFNITKPDFILVWNMAFDMPYIIERIKNLGYNPEDIICHPDFKTKIAHYYKDTRNENEFAERGDNAIISSYSVYLDQLIHFASRRKGQHAFPDYRLDTIGNLIANVRKLDYSHITTDIAKLPYLNYKIFVFYNIIDTIVQKCIETKVGDIDYVFNKCLINNTRYHKCHRQTVYLVNRGIKEFYNNEFIMGCNINRTNKKDDKYPGAFVADPTKIDNYAKKKISDNPINIMDNLDDYDYKSLYPSIMREFNIAPNTQIGMVNIPNKVYENENKFNREIYRRGAAFVEDLQSNVYLEFCTRWFNLADYATLYKDIIEYYTTKAYSARSLKPYNNNKLNILRFINGDFKQKVISFGNENERQRVIDFNYQYNFDAINDHFKRSNI